MIPTVDIFGVFHGKRRLGQAKRAKRVDHDRELFGALLTDRAFVGSRMGTVRNAVRMHGEGRPIDSLARHELAFDVVEHFVGVDVRMIVRRGNRFRVVIVEPRAERAERSAPPDRYVAWPRIAVLVKTIALFECYETSRVP